MALTICQECGVQISDKAWKCPKCGYPGLLRSSNVKFAIILGVIMLILLVFFFIQLMPQ